VIMGGSRRVSVGLDEAPDSGSLMRYLGSVGRWVRWGAGFSGSWRGSWFRWAWKAEARSLSAINRSGDQSMRLCAGEISTRPEPDKSPTGSCFHRPTAKSADRQPLRGPALSGNWPGSFVSATLLTLASSKSLSQPRERHTDERTRQQRHIDERTRRERHTDERTGGHPGLGGVAGERGRGAGGSEPDHGRQSGLQGRPRDVKLVPSSGQAVWSGDAMRRRRGSHWPRGPGCARRLFRLDVKLGPSSGPRLGASKRPTVRRFAQLYRTDRAAV